MKYKVIKGFYKLSNQTGYNVGDEIELTEAEAKEKAKEGLIQLKVGNNLYVEGEKLVLDVTESKKRKEK